MSGAIATAAIVGGIGAAGSIGGAAIASSGANKAAQTQASAADQAAQLQYQASQNALDFQKQQYATSQQELQPWLQSGGAALSNLNYLLGLGGQYNSTAPTSASVGNTSLPAFPGAQSNVQSALPLGFDPSTGQGTVTGGASPVGGSGMMSAGQFASAPSPSPSASPSFGNVNPNLGAFGSLMQANPYSTFTPPTGLTEQNDPGYQARLKLGTDALQKSAAARGSLLTGGTAKALDQFGQDYASNEFGNVYNRAFNTNAANFNNFANNQANQYNRLASLAGLGQTTAQQMGTLGQSAANSAANTGLSAAQMIGQNINNAGAANASGYAAQGNIWGNTLAGLGNNLGSMYAMYGGNNSAGMSPSMFSPVAQSSLYTPYEPDYSAGGYIG